ncbi:hypothetical protein NL676_001378 [Syzygium grande]|nr:hypothetical protein NL676_001378 [Syzygium grande]
MDGLSSMTGGGEDSRGLATRGELSHVVSRRCLGVLVKPTKQGRVPKLLVSALSRWLGLSISDGKDWKDVAAVQGFSDSLKLLA